MKNQSLIFVLIKQSSELFGCPDKMDSEQTQIGCVNKLIIFEKRSKNKPIFNRIFFFLLWFINLLLIYIYHVPLNNYLE